ncbi:MAG: AAA family ATPase [Myxococcales bacterium]|nr:AAA family ATPase [Myxococcales bacterium]MDH5307430.1 AAA family ATPase [Myxococcales bacterium]MDH5567705.1 AAA family ATPase [Myxococcales bacterium]
MYESFFGLRETPFALTPDPRFLWPSETHEEGFATLYYGITRRKGFLLLTGEVGAGKTTLLRAVLDQIPANIETALVMNTAELSGLDLLKLIAAEFRLAGSLSTRADYLIALNQFLLERLQAGLNTVLVIDEAQNLDAGILEQIRLLSNLETHTEKLLQIVLTGQPELRQMLARPEMSPLRQRIALEHHVQPLRIEEVAPYLAYRIQVAGGRCEDTFEPGAERIFYDFSSGCPRLLNLLADRALLAAYAAQRRPVPPSLVEAKAKEIAAARSAQGAPGGGGGRFSSASGV